MACPSPELTSNIRAMSPVTLEMSRNSGWLKLRACCRVERGTRTRRKEGVCAEREVSGKRAAGPVSGLKEGGQGTQAELTKNIQRMVVTLDVSKLRG